MENTKPTDEQVAAEIKWLEENKGNIPSHTSFGDSNIAAINVQLEVLRERLTEEQVFDRAEENGWSDRVTENACDAAMWLTGEEPDNRPSSENNWGGLVRK